MRNHIFFFTPMLWQPIYTRIEKFFDDARPIIWSSMLHVRFPTKKIKHNIGRCFKCPLIATQSKHFHTMPKSFIVISPNTQPQFRFFLKYRCVVEKYDEFIIIPFFPLFLPVWIHHTPVKCACFVCIWLKVDCYGVAIRSGTWLRKYMPTRKIVGG